MLLLTQHKGFQYPEQIASNKRNRNNSYRSNGIVPFHHNPNT